MIAPPRVYLHDGLMRRIGQIVSAEAVARSYAIMQPGAATFVVSYDDALYNECDPELARGVVIESTAYPYPWVGVITDVDFPAGADTARFMARSRDGVLSERLLPADFVVRGAAGQQATRVLQQVNRVNDSGIGLGNLRATGPARAFTVSDRTAYAALTSIARTSGNEWWVQDAVDNRGLVVSTLQFADARGVDLCDRYGLQAPQSFAWEGGRKDMSDTMYALTLVGGQDDATTAYSARARARSVSAAATLGAGARVAAAQTVLGHGLEHTVLASSPLSTRERLQGVESLKDAGALQSAADLALRRSPRPQRAIRGAALDDGSDVPWAQLAVGNIIGLRVPERGLFFGGFDGCARIIGVQPKEHGDGAQGPTCGLVLQIVGPHADRATQVRG